ncbi:glypican-3 isoform X1 [Antechinus flavipes]|uniref:glypican-3 isoform X1 n=1 Tax=Antechinus flavipes TaxID=38775 RepID=UPI002235E8D4|nr:glypican-3 isoform X1 [Antechinus flavipes]
MVGVRPPTGVDMKEQDHSQRPPRFRGGMRRFQGGEREHLVRRGERGAGPRRGFCPRMPQFQHDTLHFGSGRSRGERVIAHSVNFVRVSRSFPNTARLPEAFMRDDGARAMPMPYPWWPHPFSDEVYGPVMGPGEGRGRMAGHPNRFQGFHGGPRGPPRGVGNGRGRKPAQMNRPWAFPDLFHLADHGDMRARGTAHFRRPPTFPFGLPEGMAGVGDSRGSTDPRRSRAFRNGPRGAAVGRGNPRFRPNPQPMGTFPDGLPRGAMGGPGEGRVRVNIQSRRCWFFRDSFHRAVFGVGNRRSKITGYPGSSWNYPDSFQGAMGGPADERMRGSDHFRRSWAFPDVTMITTHIERRVRRGTFFRGPQVFPDAFRGGMFGRGNGRFRGAAYPRAHQVFSDAFRGRVIGRGDGRVIGRGDGRPMVSGYPRRSRNFHNVVHGTGDGRLRIIDHIRMSQAIPQGFPGPAVGARDGRALVSTYHRDYQPFLDWSPWSYNWAWHRNG